MKNKMLWIGSVFILILSVICFVVFGVGTELIRAITGESNGTSFGKYNGKDIVLAPGTDFANAVQNYTNYYQYQGQELDQSAYFYIYNYAFNSAVQSAAYKDAVKKSGYKPSGKEISRAMLPHLLNAEGKFDPKLYNKISNSDKEAMKSDISNQLTWQRFYSDMFGGSETVGKYALYGIKTNDSEKDFLASLSNEKRALKTAAFNKADYPEEEIKKFGTENASLFDSYSLSVITVKDESQAKKLYGQLTNNEIIFKDAITEYSEKYYSDGDGVVKQNYAYQIKENLENEADFAKIDTLAKDAASEVIKTNKGYSIFQSTGSKKTASLDDSATLDVVKNYITTNKQDLIESYFIEKAKDLIAKTKETGLNHIFDEKNDLTVENIPAFSLNYGNLSIAGTFAEGSAKAFAGASTNEEFLKKVFSMKKDEISEPMVMGSYITVFQVTDIQNEAASEEQIEKIASETANYDQTSAQSALLSSPKVENNVTSVYFNKIIKQ